MTRIRTTVGDLLELFDKGITVQHIAVMGEDLRTCRTAESITEAHRFMEDNDFDVIPITSGERIVGYIAREDNVRAENCETAMREFQPSDLVSDSTPILRLLEILKGKPRAFVFQGDEVMGLVTRGDLQRAPVRMLLFELIILLEMQMLRLIRLRYPDEEWKDFITPDRFQEAKRLFEIRCKRNEEVDIIDCLQFCDKRDIVLKDKNLRTTLGFDSRRKGEKMLDDLQELRDRLAHGVDIIEGSSWDEVVDLSKRAESIIKRCETEVESQMGAA